MIKLIMAVVLFLVSACGETCLRRRYQSGYGAERSAAHEHNDQCGLGKTRDDQMGTTHEAMHADLVDAANAELKSAKPWNVIVPWFVIYPGVDHKATNVRVKVYKISILMLLKSTNEWKKINTGDGKPGWASNYKFNLGTK